MPTQLDRSDVRYRQRRDTTSVSDRFVGNAYAFETGAETGQHRVFTSLWTPLGGTRPSISKRIRKGWSKQKRLGICVHRFLLIPVLLANSSRLVINVRDIYTRLEV